MHFKVSKHQGCRFGLPETEGRSIWMYIGRIQFFFAKLVLPRSHLNTSESQVLALVPQMEYGNRQSAGSNRELCAKHSNDLVG